jgi:hypothetical protein
MKKGIQSIDGSDQLMKPQVQLGHFVNTSEIK